MNTKEIIEQAKAVANQEATKFFNEKLNGEDKYACGFAWVHIYGIRANSQVGKDFLVWHPIELNVQNVDTQEVGAEAYANVLREHGFRAYAVSRLD